MAVEELLLRNPIVELVTIWPDGKTFVLFIHSFNKELSSDPEQVVCQAHKSATSIREIEKFNRPLE